MTTTQPAPPDASTPDSTIVVRELTKTFGATRALDGFSLTVPTGQVTGFLGPNGAGKSTAIRVLLGLLKATSGQATVLGMDPWTESVRIHHRLAYVPGDTNLWPNLTGGEAIDVLTRSSLNKLLHAPRSMCSPAGSRARPIAPGEPSSSSASNWTRPNAAAPTPRAIGRRSPWSRHCRGM